MTDLTLRPATADDIPKIRALHEANWRVDYAPFVPTAVMDERLSDRMDAYWAAGLPDGLTALVAGRAELLGFVVFGPSESGGLFVENLHVAASARGQGVGRRLLAAVAAEAGERPLRLAVLEANVSARAAYRAWGGQEGAPFAATLMDHPVRDITVNWPRGADFGGLTP